VAATRVTGKAVTVTTGVEKAVVPASAGGVAVTVTAGAGRVVVPARAVAVTIAPLVTAGAVKIVAHARAGGTAVTVTVGIGSVVASARAMAEGQGRATERIAWAVRVLTGTYGETVGSAIAAARAVTAMVVLQVTVGIGTVVVPARAGDATTSVSTG
jgi:hypothetical protein